MEHTAQIINGKAVSDRLLSEIAAKTAAMATPPGLAVVLVGDNPASHIYVANKVKACAKAGIRSLEHRLPADATESEIKGLIETLNADPEIDGILLQLPLPDGLDSDMLIQTISPDKDVDGLTIPNIGKLVAGLDGLVPCTPQGSMMLIKEVCPDLTGKHAVVIGRSLLFGKPMAQLLLAANATVTTAHSKTADLPEICKQADILVAAVGRPKMVKADWVKKGAIVIDVGINRLDTGKLCGDVDFDEVSSIASAISPVPGGVGPMTIACLMANTLKAHQ
ncbi:MAG: bifunctional methylenetetrahydrofolate dehydrogenase/methenyltetrahydrofolate cyclohydrolase FolD [Alphaproteobacteria bacterium]|jgi:methylenetetrahydrofolate dehydrogenase (NADP+)/methenyltetrahydrofolate cyclohydrolase|nr:bifunctional methylenetetrahydrofolate dehydrogenase/methenyltetrahydrofolate cyclohydrolase FolD [Alphaproteobacteria bacterium]MCB1551157.1 bifunctional methylenetetrahydrofolate dehydrogenase/methenyltetrahydrofolate cyclohydrolase FolD [Alphaproteobacteria bacterium]MCB9985383.1 bifunctional methylenetetrahydrofolate dehydrogenase/methenyltetrahydrofolate cyclohydrolase FolD [Micavibrio sp.]HPQ51497.1 bifunctional methylenetetrahydrofolate dehydrogenase/methenyltetrahydrofolate cyclohydro